MAFNAHFWYACLVCLVLAKSLKRRFRLPDLGSCQVGGKRGNRFGMAPLGRDLRRAAMVAKIVPTVAPYMSRPAVMSFVATCDYRLHAFVPHEQPWTEGPITARPQKVDYDALIEE